MSSTSIHWSMFTKPWPQLPLTELADLVAGMGFDAIEFPLRPGFQIDLADLPRSAVRASSILRTPDCGSPVSRVPRRNRSSEHAPTSVSRSSASWRR